MNHIPGVKIAYTELADRDISIPSYETKGSVGMDLRANLKSWNRDGGMEITPGTWLLIPTGIKIQLPQHMEAQIRGRSGLALKKGITVLNSPGTIDSDYRGEVGVILLNNGSNPFTVKHGERIAQMIFGWVATPAMELVEELDDTDRGDSGFGSTGNK